MNKPPQPITGPTSVPNPAPSPGLTQVRASTFVERDRCSQCIICNICFSSSPPKAAYGPGQPPSLVFATPPPPQMNSAPQPRQVLVHSTLVFLQHPRLGTFDVVEEPSQLPPLDRDFQNSFLCNKALANSVCVGVYVCIKTYFLLSSSLNVALDFFPLFCCPPSLLQGPVLYTNRY